MHIIDSHTEGEPTRVIISGGPDLGRGPLSERLAIFQKEYDHIRKSVILEPRGSDVLVGALLCEPVNKNCATGVIFFNNTGYLKMCGHGTIGVAKTLQHLGLITERRILIETPVGVVSVNFTQTDQIEIMNVPSYLFAENVQLKTSNIGDISGDIAWGGNWFFLTSNTPSPLTLDNCHQLTYAAKQVKNALIEQGITGANGAEIDHIEFFSEPVNPNANSRNFVLCPGDAYDRSPCGTGTSAKIACLATKNQLEPEQTWIQESIIGSLFSASYTVNPQGEIIPKISGRAYITAESKLYFDNSDPFRNGISAT